MAPPTLVNLGLRHILVRAPVISSGGSLDKALWKDISLGSPPSPTLPHLSLSSDSPLHQGFKKVLLC